MIVMIRMAVFMVV